MSLASPPAVSAAAPITKAEPPRAWSAGEIAAALDRLQVVGSVLYVAAHPDDENTRLLTWLVGERGLRAGYLSMTRGDGGQNLIGPEQAELLGLIRTQELLAARRIDGAEQLFTRARDFGYSKSADETLRIWGKEEVLADVVRAIRQYQPDVIITRFTTSPPNHGHHTASAILAAKAFEAAADAARFPEQLGALRPWRTDRLLYNVSTWRMAPDADMSAYLALDVGGYDPLSGRSWGEIAALSRSQHKSQGFGAASSRGPTLEYFDPLAGTRPKKDPFEGLDFTWRRFPGTDDLIAAIDAAREAFDARAPHESVSALRRVHRSLSALPDDNPYKRQKLADVEALLLACAGLWLDVTSPEASAVPGTKLSVRVEALNRSSARARLRAVRLPDGSRVSIDTPLVHHRPFALERELALPKDARVSTPFWLEHPPEGGLYSLEDEARSSEPEGEAPLVATFDIAVDGVLLQVRRPLRHTWVDPVRGELSRVVEVAPLVTLGLTRQVIMVPNGTPQEVSVDIVGSRDPVEGKLRLELPPGWSASPSEVPFTLGPRGDSRSFPFRVIPPKGPAGQAPGTLRAVAEVGGQRLSWSAREVDYEHIPPQAVRTTAEARLVPLSLSMAGKRIGYIPGPGDEVAESLAAVGFEVTLLPDERLARERLSSFDAIVVGVRAFNANPRLAAQQERLLEYVEEGGRLIVQYNTNNRVGPLTVDIGPYPLEISRDYRVTDETAPMIPLRSDEPLLLKPNRLDSSDFEGWVQERGLYFAATWDDRYRPVFRMHDEGEPPLEGGLLVARHGRGTFVYTGLSFFRQLPAGVPGAYRLMANLLAL